MGKLTLCLYGMTIMLSSMATQSWADGDTPRSDPSASDERARLVFDAYPRDHIFTADNLLLPTRVTNKTQEPLSCSIRTVLAEYRPNADGDAVDEVTRKLTIAPGEIVETPAAFIPKQAGPYEFRVELIVDDQIVQHSESTLLYKPAQWMLPDLEPKDFDVFWKQTLDEQNSRPLEPKIIEPADRRLIPEPFMEVRFNGLGNRRIRGYLGIPTSLKPGEKAPAILSLPSASYHSAAVEPKALEQGYVFLAISIHDMPFGGESGRTHPREHWFEEPYQGIGRQSKETYYYRAGYAAGPRAVEYLRSLPQVDPDRIIVQGLSQGGSLALATAALTPNLAMVEVQVPGRSRMDLLNGLYQANMTLDPPPGMTRNDMLERTLLYYDVSYFARRIQCPVLMRLSIDDQINPGPLQYWAFMQLKNSSDARVSMKPWAGHHTPADPEGLAKTMRQLYASPRPSEP